MPKGEGGMVTLPTGMYKYIYVRPLFISVFCDIVVWGMDVYTNRIKWSKNFLIGAQWSQDDRHLTGSRSSTNSEIYDYYR